MNEQNKNETTDAKEVIEDTVTEGGDGGQTVQNIDLDQLESTLEATKTLKAGASNKAEANKSNLSLIMDVEVPISVELGRTAMAISSVLELGPGSVVELEKMASDPVDLYVNNKLIARGEVVVVDENFGIRITSVVTPRERVKSLA